MPGPIHSIVAPAALPDIKPPKLGGEVAGEGGEFKNVLSDAVRQVEQFRQEAEINVNQFLAGERSDLHNVALATQRAEMSLEMFLQTRNKVVQAYQEIMRMQV